MRAIFPLFLLLIALYSPLLNPDKELVLDNHTMGSDTSSGAAAVDAPPLEPLNIRSRLANTPDRSPKYTVTVKNAAGADVVVADPDATRTAVALMNIHAVTGGAACHWGGAGCFCGNHGGISRTNVWC